MRRVGEVKQAEFVCRAQRPEAQRVGAFGIELKQQRAGDGVEVGHARSMAGGGTKVKGLKPVFRSRKELRSTR